MHLYLIRHGQSPVNLADWPHGNSDEGLTALGRRQAAAVARRLAGELDGVDALYTSTMRRARQTADAIAAALGADVVDDDRIREIGNNRLDHSPWPDLPTDYGDFWSTERPFASVTPAYERGESLMHFRTRIGAFLEHLWTHHSGGTVVTVSHGGVIDAVFDHLFNVGPWRRCQVWTANAALTHVEALPVEGGHPGPERWRLHRHNCVAHLAGVEAAPLVADAASPPPTEV